MPYSLPRLLSKLQSVIGIDTANNDLRIANAVVFSDGTRQTTAGVAVDAFARDTANGANGLATGAYGQANTATGLAQAAFDSANNVLPQIQPAWNTANTAYDNTLYLQSVNNTQNTNIDIIRSVNDWQNTEIIAVNGLAHGAFNTANNNSNHIAIIEGVNLTQNSDIIAINQYATSAYNTANTASANTIIIQGVNETQNTRLTEVEFLAQYARNTANNAVANTNILAAVNLTQNTRINSIETINENQNTTITAVNQFAQSAYDKANSNTFIDITVSGNVTSGNINTTSIFVTANAYVAGARVLTGNDLATTTYTPEYITMDPALVTVPTVGTSTTYGTYNFGSVTDIQTYGDYNANANTGFYSVNDATGAPGHVEYIGFTNVVDFNRLVLSVNYTAQSGHIQDIDLYNYDTDAWDTFGTYSGSGTWQQIVLGLIDSAPYISPSANVTLRNYHISNGNAQHRTWFDYVAIEKSVTGGQGPKGSTGATGATGPTGPIDYSAANTAQAAYDAANTKLSLTGGTVTGNVTINGNLDVTGNISYTGNVTTVTITGNSGQFFGNTATGFEALYAGIPTGYDVQPYTVFQVTSNSDSFAQINHQNINAGNDASTDLVATADNGNEDDTFIDMGINSSTYNNPDFSLTGPNDGYVYVHGNTDTGGGNLIFATMDPKDIIFAVQGQKTENEVMRITSANNVVIKNQLSINGQDWQSVEDTQNTEITAVNQFAQSGYNQANTGTGIAQAAFDKANTGISTSNTFITINANSSLINATSNTDILTILPGNNISFVTDVINKQIIINSNLDNVTVPTLAPDRTAFVAASAQTSIAVTHTIPYVYVSINGITVDPSEYSANGTHVVLTTALRVGDVVDVTGYTTGSASVPGIKGDKGNDYASNTTMYVTDLFATGIINIGNIEISNTGANLVVHGVSDIIAHTNLGTLSLADAVQSARYANGVNITQNNNITYVNQYAASGYAIANSASANTIITQGVDTTQNTNISIIQGVDLWQNTQITAINQFAQSSYDSSNTKVSSSGGTISGSLIVSQDLTVTGNLSILGNSTVITTSTLNVSDPLIYLASNNYTSDIVDIGLIGNYNDGTNAHTGIVRDPNLKEWIFFKGYTPEVESNNLINIAHSSFAYANVYASYVKSNVIGNTIYATTSLGVGTAPSGVTGEIRAANNIVSYYTSDKQFKENIIDIPNALDKVDAIGGKLFDWTESYLNTHGGEDGYFVRKSDFGVVAQDVQAVFPVAVRSKPDGSLAVDYEKLSALAFAAIRELKKEIDDLKGKK